MTVKHYSMIVGCSIVGGLVIPGLCGRYPGQLYLTGINAVTLWFYHYDKKRVISRRGHVPEIVLHILALLGGTIGAMLGERIFRHKKRSSDFTEVFTLIVLCQMTSLLLWRSGCEVGPITLLDPGRVSDGQHRVGRLGGYVVARSNLALSTISRMIAFSPSMKQVVAECQPIIDGSICTCQTGIGPRRSG